MRKWPNPPFFGLKICLAIKTHEFFKKKNKILGKSMIWPTCPNLASIWPNLAFRGLGLALHGVLFINMYRSNLGWKEKKFQNFYQNSGWSFSVIVC